MRLVRLASKVALVLAACWIGAIAAVVWWGTRDDARPAAAIVVLGAAHYDGRPSPVLRARLDHGIALWRRGIAPRLILTGGTAAGDTTSEAEAGRRYAMGRGVPDSAILLEPEPRGRTTNASLSGVARLVRTLPSRDVILVSDPFHMLRLSIVAGRLGLEAHPSPTPTSPISRSAAERWRYTLSESLKVPLAIFFIERTRT